MCEVLCGVCQKPFVLVVSHCSAVSKVHFNQQRFFSVVVCSKKPIMFKSYFNRIRGKYTKVHSVKLFRFTMGSGASAPTDEKSQSPTIGGIGIFSSPSCWNGAFVMIATEAKMSFFCCERTYRILGSWWSGRVEMCICKQIYQISITGFARLELYPRGLDPQALEISQRTLAMSVQKCQHLSPILIWALMEGCIKTVLGRSSKYARWWFQTCLYVQPPFREDSHFDDRIFSDGLVQPTTKQPELRKWNRRSQRKHCPLTAMCLGDGWRFALWEVYEMAFCHARFVAFESTGAWQSSNHSSSVASHFRLFKNLAVFTSGFFPLLCLAQASLIKQGKYGLKHGLSNGGWTQSCNSSY